MLERTVDLADDGMKIGVNHGMRFARLVADRVIFMYAGEIVVDVAPVTFPTIPETARTRRFLTKVLSHRRPAP